MSDKVNIVNRKASFEYHFLDTYEAGIQLTGTEIKSIRQGKANIADAYCIFSGRELFVKNMHISEYELGSFYNHEPKRLRKLLLHRHELKKLKSKLNEKGLTLILRRVYINEKGLAKVELVLAQGKKSFDKRQSIKERETKRNLQRQTD